MKTEELKTKIEDCLPIENYGVCFIDCDAAGVDKAVNKLLFLFQSEIEAAEKAKEEQLKEATVKFFKEQKEIAQIRGDAFWVHEFDLQIFGQPLNGCSLFLKNPEQ